MPAARHGRREVKIGLLDDIETVARGWRWGRRPPVPASAGRLRSDQREFPTAWARSPAARAARFVILRLGFAPLIRMEVDKEVLGSEILEAISPPVILVANHSSHLDAPLLLTSLPESWRRRTAVGAAADYFFDVWWRAAATALAFNAFPVERVGTRRSTGLAQELLDAGWNIFAFPEGTRSQDGWMGEFRGGAARLAIDAGVPVVPIALRGTYQAMPRGRPWPEPGRPPVSVRFGKPLYPDPAERTAAFTRRIRAALAALLYEDSTSWWAAKRADARGELPDPAGPEAAPWRRRWEASRPLPEGSRPRAWPRG